MLIKEIFPTIQGEGNNSGMPSVFCRLGECNLRCYFCDTDFLKGLKNMTPQEVASEISQFTNQYRNVVFTGGEPFLQQKELTEVMAILRKDKKRWFFCVETNGMYTIENGFGHEIDWICCSPKNKMIKLQLIDEVKVVFTKELSKLAEYFYKNLKAKYYYLSPEAPAFSDKEITPIEYLEKSNIKDVIAYIKDHPWWSLNLQKHKLLGIK